MANNPTAKTQATETQTSTSDPLQSWLKQSLKPSLAKDPAVQQGVKAMVDSVLEDASLVSDDVLQTLRGIVAELDKKLSDQINLIIHSDEFKAVESAWRGLHTLVMKSQLDSKLKIRVLNVSKDEVRKTLDKFPGESWNKGPLFNRIYNQEYGTPGGEPYGCIIGDYEFTHNPADVKILSGMAKIAAAAHAPFITGGSPELLKIDSWAQLPDITDVTKKFTLPEYAAWRSLRDHEDSRYLALAFPRFMSRLPYGAKSNPVDEFAFEEDVAGGNHERYAWSNAAYAMGLNISRSYSNYGWTCSIRGVDSGGRVDGLPVSVFETDDGGQDIVCPTEVAITQAQELDLANNGFMPLSHFKNTDYAAFIGAQSLQKPKTYDLDSATANAKISARLPYLFASCRFAHYLKVMVYRMAGRNMEREDIDRELNRWITTYVLADPKNATDEQRAEKPLADAKVFVEASEDDPGWYSAKFLLRPHFQLEGVDVALRLVANIPAKKS
ncbi:MAG: type VI secretion system contractile sheath large subunit [Tepidisphaeraceae bacterium]|jgi:type VI secretion system protein ImpC